MKQNTVVDKGLSRYFANIYQYVGLNVLLAGATAFFVASNSTLFFLSIGLFRYVVMFLPFVITFYLQTKLQQISTSFAQVLFFLYGVNIGFLISWVFVVYTSESVFSSFFVSGALFIVASIYGRFSSRDITSWRYTLTVACFAILVSLLINYFLCSSFLGYLLSVAIIVVFSGFIALDTRDLLSMYFAKNSEEMVEKISIFGALHLFISFINVFLSLLNLSGRKK